MQNCKIAELRDLRVDLEFIDLCLSQFIGVEFGLELGYSGRSVRSGDQYAPCQWRCAMKF